MSPEKVKKKMKDKVLEKIRTMTNTIGLELTTYCPLQCKYCTRNMLERKDRKLEWEKFLEVSGKLSGFSRLVICGMGEPMVYPHIYEAVSELEQKLILITSGTVAIDYERLNRKKNIEVIVFSIDAPTEEEMVSITGNYNWSNLLQNLRPNRYNSRISRVMNCTVTGKNYERIPDLARFAVQHRMQAVSFTMEIRRTEEDDAAQKVPQYLEEAAQIAKRRGVVFTSSYKHVKCMSWGNVVPYINIDGEFFPCCQGVNRKYAVGNIFESTVDQVWESEAYNKFKQGNMCLYDCPIFSDITSEVTQ